PIIVTSNYEYTYIKVMKDLKNIDAWVLCVDSDGINVWCAARGGDFGNQQLVEAVKTTGIRHLIDDKTLILPQLAAGGVESPKLTKGTSDFPFKIKYGPIWSKDLPEYLEKHPSKKPPYMRIARFTLGHRIRAGITHFTFLLRKIFLIPLLLLTTLFTPLNWSSGLMWTAEFVLSLIFINLILVILFPLTNFTRSFIKKGIIYGGINSALMTLITWFFHAILLYSLFNLVFHFWIGFFNTMSFSGFTMPTNPREIQEEYPLFNKANKIFFSIGIIFSIISLIYLIFII
ncbi:MAG: hypothetical protein ACTSWE_10200, partial [Promethearchaeota archaeon]